MIATLEQRLPEHDVAADVRWLLRHKRPANLNRRFELSGLAILVRESRENATRILGKLFEEIVD
jgi:hypothetical protein